MLRPPRRPARPARPRAPSTRAARVRRALVVIALAAAAGAAVYSLTPWTNGGRRAQPAGEARILLGDAALQVDPAFLLRPDDRIGGRMAELHLGFDARHFGPAPTPAPLAPDMRHASPDLVRLILKPPDARLSPAERTERLYLRHLDPESAPSVAGLSLRRFTPESPYGGEELHFTPPDGALFAARCERMAQGESLPPSCIADLRVDGLDARLEFKAEWLEDWETLARVTREAVAGMKKAAAAAAAGPEAPASPVSPVSPASPAERGPKPGAPGG